MPGPLDYLQNLLVGKYKTPELSPEAQAEQDARATSMQESDPSLNAPWQKAGRSAIDAIAGLARGVTGIGDQGPGGKTWTNAGALASAALPLATPLKELGMFSRVEKAASELPEMIHPNKAISIFKNQASPEEVNFRGLGDFLKGKGNEMIPKKDIISHLEGNPAPEVRIKELGKPLYEDSRYKAGGPPENPTRYQSYQLPGGENYRETLFKTPPKMKKTGEYFHDVTFPEDPTKGPALYEPDQWAPGESLENYDPTNYTAKGIYRHGYAVGKPEYGNAYADRFGGIVSHSSPIEQPDPLKNYFGPHWNDDPNVLVHSRTQDRTLPSNRQWTPEDFIPHKPEEGGPMWSFRNPKGELESWFGSTPEEARQFGVDMWNQGPEMPSGPKIRNIENIQSDWHQTGAKTGYGNTLSEEEQKSLQEQARLHHQKYQHGLDSLAAKIGYDRDPNSDSQLNTLLGIYRQTDPELGKMIDANNENFDRYVEYLDKSNGGERVPDAPFKDKGWLDLGLKHQILDVANNPDIQGISVTPGEEMVKRGEGHSPKFNNETIPNALKKLLTPFGAGNPETISLGTQMPPTSGPGSINIHDNSIIKQGPSADNTDYTELASLWPRPPVELRPLNFPNDRPMTFPSREEAYQYMDQHMGGSGMIRNPTPNKNAMQSLLDQVIKSNQAPINAPYFKISPEVKELIKKKGLPLMTIMGLIQSQQNSNQQEQ